MKCTNIRIIGVPEEERKGRSSIWRKIAENFPKKETSIQVQVTESKTRWTQRNPHQDIIKMAKVKREFWGQQERNS